ncbi:hypothetical protein SDC9_174106 [bioreactor metagenome]|uniref:Uncharacterized protein n=1 Tax=bioreactor metagenome TaxID=1076179 RepID=A0A645GI78_9ZZZZ
MHGYGHLGLFQCIVIKQATVDKAVVVLRLDKDSGRRI